MLNTEHSYYEAGFKCGKADKKGDETMRRCWRNWLHEAVSAEANNEDKAEGRRLFDQGFRDGKGIA